MTELPTPEMRHDRSLQDAKTSNDLARAASQAVILINGAAATALLAYAGAKGVPRFVTLPWALLCYALGVFSGALMMILLSLALEKWMIGWFPETGDRVRSKLHNRAEKLWHWCLIAFGISAALFLLGSGLAAFGLFLGAPSLLPSPNPGATP